ncbi:MAG: 16S rRNA (cytidine(1402)-2'-O)-methyltransferase [Bacilli bacterium]|nr:16S rRNA (cytidine(1402)-2'-O)-methyltransferase [Bacilli bacterium]
MGTLYIVATPIGNMGDISKRAVEVLEQSSLILCEDTRNSGILLNILNIKNKLVSYHKFNEERRSEEIIDLLKKGDKIALITDAGTPCISDPGSVIVKECIKNNIDVFSIPGPSAIITALSVSGLTISNFSFYGFLERKSSSQKEHLKMINEGDTEIAVFYESPKRIIDTLENIKEVMNNPYTIVLNDLTKLHEKKYYGNTDEVILELQSNKNYELGEYVIIVSKNKKEKAAHEDISPEAILIDTLVKEKCTLKDAIKIASLNNKLYSKNEYYDASINLKKLF